MNKTPKPEEDLVDAFRQLGQNLVDTMRMAWDSQERKKIQEEIENGLVDVASVLKKEAADFGTSESGQQLKEELNDLRQRWESGEAEAKARQELLNVIHLASDELQKWAERWQKGPEE